MSNLEKMIAEEMKKDSSAPVAKAEKGDAKPVKQGSSDAAEIGSGKGEIVKPEENPVDKAVKSVKGAEAGSKEISGDPQQKGEAPAEKQPSLKKVKEEEDSEESKPSKMEMIKSMVSAMKDMDKEKLMAMYMKSSKDMEEEVEISEDSTKAEIARAFVEMMKKKDEDDVEESFNTLFVEDSHEEEEEDEDEDENKKESTKKEEVEVESSLVDIEVDEDLAAISESLDLSEENTEKAKTIFKAAINSKAAEINEQLKSQYENELKTTVDSVKSDLTEAVDKYLSYVAEEWAKENELAIERGLRSEMTENFIDGLKTLFTEHYVDVPEDKYNVIDELANKLDDMELKLDAEVSKNMEMTEEMDSLKRANVIREASDSLSDSQSEKLSSLCEGVDFKDIEDFSDKVNELKEAYFPASEKESISEETLEIEGIGTLEEESSEPVLDPSMSRYASALSKLKPLG